MTEQLGDLVGREIRYGHTHPDPPVQLIVDALHEESEALAQLEAENQNVVDILAGPASIGTPEAIFDLLEAADLEPPRRATLMQLLDEHPQLRSQGLDLLEGYVERLQSHRERLERVRAILETAAPSSSDEGGGQ